MNNNIAITKHYAQRFRKRIAPSKRIAKFANEAFVKGKEIDALKDSRIRKTLIEKEKVFPENRICKIYNGNLHVFDAENHIAITVFHIGYNLCK